MNFKSFGLPEQLLQSLEKLRFETPTSVQEKAIPAIMDGKDVLVSSQTGTGKTGAFAIPIISNIVDDPDHIALIITPTRELASQIQKNFNDFIGNQSVIKSALLIGGESIVKQLNRLKQKPNIIVGTPGRITDHLNRKSLNLKNVKFLVLDETDRMLDMGFTIQIDDIVKHVPRERQTLLFSATLPANIIKMSNKYMNNPLRISVGSSVNPIEKIKQEVINVKDDSKYPQLLEQLNTRDGSILVFVKTKYGVERMVKKLRAEKYEANGIHGDLSHNKREQVIRNFRDQKFVILVATDIIARGLDIPHIQHVINYDLPQCPEDYIHRIGRTARAGNEGSAVSFVSPSEKRIWDDIYYMMNPDLKREAQAANKRPPRKGGRSFSDNRKKRFGGNNRRKQSR